MPQEEPPTLIQLDPSINLDLLGQRTVDVEFQFEIPKYMPRVFAEQTIAAKHGEWQRTVDFCFLHLLLHTVSALRQPRFKVAMLAHEQDLLRPDLSLGLEDDLSFLWRGVLSTALIVCTSPRTFQ